MLTLLKNLNCYAPSYIGKNDILICGEKIFRIAPRIENCPLAHTIDLDGLLAFPGIIDQHVHITGGGGEDGFESRIPEVSAAQLIGSGVTTAVGLLGADGCCRSLETLYAKAKALESAGLTTYIYSGSYRMPPQTITGDVIKDLVFIDKVIGVGETALSDRRSSGAELALLLKTASEAYLGGLISGKAGVFHLHFGDGKGGLSPLLEMVKQSDLPIAQFVPTHMNRSEELFIQAVEYCKIGGQIDLTSGEKTGVPVPDAMRRLAEYGAPMQRVTISSDGGGGGPGGSVCRVSALYEDIISCITKEGLDPGDAFSPVTENVARLLKIYPRKGALTEGADADILITDKNYKIIKLFGRGRPLAGEK